MFSIRQTGEHSFEVLRDGVVIDTVATRELAVAALTTAALATLDRQAGRLATAPEGALPERWRGGSYGIVQAADTGDGRNFTECVFSWRDPAVSLLPLMLQQVTEVSHYAAELAGWIDELSLRGDNGVDAGGWFYDNEAGVQFRNILRASGRFGVSVDPGEVEWEDVCTEMDPDGFYCVDGFTNFLAYQVIGLTGTPFPAFGNCYIELDGAAAAGEGAPADDTGEAGDDAPADTGDSSASAVPAVVAAGAARATPARVDVAVFTMPEPPDGDARYVPQDDEGRLAIPLTINDDGSLYAHGAAWGTCHIGYRDECVEPPPSPSGYAQFHLGANPYGFEHLPTGTLVLNCDHAHRNGLAHEARDHYANTAMAWADVRATDGVHGIWLRGMVRPEVLANPELMRVLRASSLSGDWRAFGTALDCVAFQSCSVPGFPIRRQALAAAGGIQIADPVLRQRRREGQIIELVGAGIVRPATVRTEALTAAGTVDCGPCARRSRAAQRTTTPSSAGLERKLDALLAAIGTVERRTRHLAAAEQQAITERLTRR